jgi:phosphate:Na+ symporter
VLLFMSIAYSHFVTPAAALALVLGANLGSAINPVLEAGHRGDLASYRLPVGNLLNRLVGIAVVAPFLHTIATALSSFQPDPSRMTAEFHVAFNVGTALVFIGLLDPLAWLLEKLFPRRSVAGDPSAPRYLDESLLEAPSLALADAARLLHSATITIPRDSLGNQHWLRLAKMARPEDLNIFLSTNGRQ